MQRSGDSSSNLRMQIVERDHSGSCAGPSDGCGMAEGGQQFPGSEAQSRKLSINLRGNCDRRDNRSTAAVVGKLH